MRNRRHRSRAAVAAATAALLGATVLTACGDSGTGAGRGTLNVAITDAPFPYAEVDSAIVHVVRVDAKQEDATEAEADVLPGAGVPVTEVS